MPKKINLPVFPHPKRYKVAAIQLEQAQNLERRNFLMHYSTKMKSYHVTQAKLKFTDKLCTYILFISAYLTKSQAFNYKLDSFY